MTMLNVTDAADAAGVSRTTIYERLRSGELSKTPDGIDPAELIRVFGELKGEGTTAVAAEPESADAVHVAWLREMVDQQRATIERKDAELREAETRAADERRGLLAQLDRMTLLLPAPEPAPEPPRGFWRRVLS